MRSLVTACASLWAVILLEIPQVRCEMKEAELNMAPWSFDDQYSGCEDRMAEKISSTGLLETELNNDGKFKEAWQKAEQTWGERKRNGTIPALPPGFTDEHGIAILVYTGAFYYRLNEAVRWVGVSPQDYMETFPYKALHYYLTRALQLLEKNCFGGCQTVYRGAKNIHFTPSSGKGSTIRFGQFTSTSLKKDVALFFGNDSFFTIKTCLGACIASMAALVTENEVLIPPYEIFNVTNFNKDEHTFVLTSTEMRCSNYNCTYLGGGKPNACGHAGKKPSPWFCGVDSPGWVPVVLGQC
ncbi:ecto-ADP-ribosyltransferase 5-like [Rhinatrema bivittatum]|uniref:ecto-ADP-ribosyltransferase 5-like n=1 Tax=Rhinatrema bivittatum TaxID=194408 RepID=UPI00112A9B83|nr:ecto-ADP-ribosyltransferase 5-like [Rhinatrema bivittatum]